MSDLQEAVSDLGYELLGVDRGNVRAQRREAPTVLVAVSSADALLEAIKTREAQVQNDLLAVMRDGEALSELPKGFHSGPEA
jgi:hypothetical protein